MVGVLVEFEGSNQMNENTKCILLTWDDLKESGKKKSLHDTKLADFDIDTDIINSSTLIGYVPLDGLSDDVLILKKKYGQVGWYKLIKQ